MRNAPTIAAQRLVEGVISSGAASINRLANVHMLVAVALFSALPLIISWGNGAATPFLFNAAMSAGIVLGCLVFLAYRYRSLVFNAGSLKFIAIRSRSLWVALSILANFNFVLLAWSTRFVDVSISAILFGTWPIFIIVITHALFRNENRTQSASQETPTTNSDRFDPLGRQLLLLLVIGLAGFAFIVVGQAGGFDKVETGSIVPLTIGAILALFSSIATGFTAFSFRWGTDLANKFPPGLKEGVEPDALDLFGLLVAYLIASMVSGILNALIGFNSGEVMDSRSLLIAVVVGGSASGVANVAWRKAKLSTRNLGVNALAYLAPVLSLLWLLLLFQIHPERLDYLIIGALGIVIVNLLINFEADTWLGFKALLLALWAFGAFVYLRDDALRYLPFGQWHWPGETYFGALALSATVFTLLRSFRVSRLSIQTQEEDNRVYTLFQNLDLLARNNVVDAAVLEYVIAIDRAVTPEKLKKAYEDVKGYLDDAEAKNPDPEKQAQLAEAETLLNVIAHSRQQGIDFGELFALLVFGGITVFLGLGSRPGIVGWIGFLVEMLVVLFSAVIVFLIVNVWDLHRERAGEILEKQIYPHRDSDGVVLYNGYGVVFKGAEDRRFEQKLSMIVGLLVALAYAGLLWYKWLP